MQNSNIRCCICYDFFNVSDIDIGVIKHDGDENIKTSRKRGHYVHKKCMGSWAKHSKSRHCPLDREVVKSIYSVDSCLLCGLKLDQFNDYYRVYDDFVSSNNGSRTLKLTTVIDNINQCDQFGRTLLYCACQRRDLDLVRALLKKGADSSIANNQGFTPLMVSVSHGQEKIVELLLRHLNNQQVYALDKQGKYALELAIQQKYSRIVAKLIAHSTPTKHQVAQLLNRYSIRLKKDFYGKEIVNQLYQLLK